MLATVQQSSDGRSVGKKTGTVALVNLTAEHATSGGGPDLEAASPLGMPTGDASRTSRLTPPDDAKEEEVRLPGDRTSRYASVRRERPPSNQQRKRELLWE